MSRSLPLVVEQAVFSQTTSKVFLVLAEFSHSSFATIRVVNNTQQIVSNGDPYVPFPFTVLLPPDDEELQVRAQLVIYDVERAIIDNLRLVAGSRERIATTLRVVEASDPDTILQRVSGLVIENVQYGADQIALDLSIDNFLTESFPRDSFSPATFPGVF